MAAVHRPQSVTVGRAFIGPSSRDDSPPPYPLASNPFILHCRSRSSWEASVASSTPPARPGSASKLLDPASDGEDDASAGASGYDVAALVDFLKNHPPPPGNFMSIPYGGGERGRWHRFKKMGKRSKSVPRVPEQIRLPDSAVSGTTIGGHRHIAISIPLEVSPLADAPRPQYPEQHQHHGHGHDEHLAVRTCIDDRGVVTVLRRPTTRASAASSPSASKPKPCFSLGQRTKTSASCGSLGSKPFDYIGILPSRFDTPPLDDSSAPWNRAPSMGEGSVPGRQSAFPPRSSSMTTIRDTHHPASIDGLILQQERWRVAAGHDSSKTSTPTTDFAMPAKPTPVLGRQPPATVHRQDGMCPAHTVISDSPIVSCADGSPPARSESTRTRRDVVRDRKRRDMEAMRSAKQKKHSGLRQDAGTADEKETAPATHGTALKSRNEAPGQVQAKSTDDKATRHLTMSSVMVVLDVEPYASLEQHARPQTAPAPGPPDSWTESPKSKPSTPEANMASPPLSARVPRPPRHSAMDRASLTRRREWKAIREQAREAVALARGRTRQLAFDGHGSMASQTDMEMMRLYEAYRENRLRDMERRLRRLERNGDVWLRALIPILDRLGAPATAADERDKGDGEDKSEAEARGWASDDEAAGGAGGRRGRDAGRRRATRRASLSLSRRLGLSQSRLLERLAAWPRDADDDDDDAEDAWRGGALKRHR